MGDVMLVSLFAILRRFRSRPVRIFEPRPGYAAELLREAAGYWPMDGVRPPAHKARYRYLLELAKALDTDSSVMR